MESHLRRSIYLIIHGNIPYKGAEDATSGGRGVPGTPPMLLATFLQGSILRSLPGNINTVLYSELLPGLNFKLFYSTSTLSYICIKRVKIWQIKS